MRLSMAGGRPASIFCRASFEERLSIMRTGIGILRTIALRFLEDRVAEQARMDDTFGRKSSVQGICRLPAEQHLAFDRTKAVNIFLQ